MACTSILQGYEIDCLDSIGGIDTIYVTEFTNVPQANITESSGVISALSCASGTKFYTLQQRKQSAQADEKLVSSPENGTLYSEQTITFNLKKMTAAMRYTIKSLAVNRLMFIVKDRNGLIKLYGQTTGCDISESTLTTGKAFGDLNGATLTFTGMEPQLSSSLSSAILDTVLV